LRWQCDQLNFAGSCFLRSIYLKYIVPHHHENCYIRAHELLETNNLRVVTGAYNTAKGSEVPGSGKATYKPYVGPNFTSSITDGGVKGALRIDGKPFVDASGKQLI
jgi:hypothetical protein